MMVVTTSESKAQAWHHADTKSRHHTETAMISAVASIPTAVSEATKTSIVRPWCKHTTQHRTSNTGSQTSTHAHA
jgi:hypothetical protein